MVLNPQLCRSQWPVFTRKLLAGFARKLTTSVPPCCQPTAPPHSADSVAAAADSQPRTRQFRDGDVLPNSLPCQSFLAATPKEQRGLGQTHDLRPFFAGPTPCLSTYSRQSVADEHVDHACSTDNCFQQDKPRSLVCHLADEVRFMSVGMPPHRGKQVV